jgi:hypothetical protein
VSNSDDIKEKIEKMLSKIKLSDKAKRDNLVNHLKELENITFDSVIDKDTIKDKFILIKFIKEKLEEKTYENN